MLKEIRSLMIDMDGVLWHGAKPLPGLHEFFATLRDLEIPFVLATNNASKTVAMYEEKLANFGVTVDKQQILTSAEATGDYLQRQYAAGTAVFVIGDAGLRDAVTTRGFQILTVEQVKAGHTAPVVVIGFTQHARYDEFAAGAILVNNGAQYVASNPDPSYPSEWGILPGAGALASVIQVGTGVDPLYIGKPGATMFQTGLERLHSRPQETAMIGDRLTTDILGAQQVGMRTILVLSGVTTKEVMHESPIRPDFVYSGIAELAQAFRPARA